MMDRFQTLLFNFNLRRYDLAHVELESKHESMKVGLRV